MPGPRAGRTGTPWPCRSAGPARTRGRSRPGGPSGMLQELLHRGDLAADRAVRHAMGQPGQHVLGHQVLLIGRRLARRVQGPRRPQVPDHSQRHPAPRLQQSRTWLAIAEDCTGMPTLFQGSATDTPARLSCHLTCDKRRPYPTRARTNCRQDQHGDGRGRPLRRSERVHIHSRADVAPAPLASTRRWPWSCRGSGALSPRGFTGRPGAEPV